MILYKGLGYHMCRYCQLIDGPGNTRPGLISSADDDGTRARASKYITKNMKSLCVGGVT